jgi:hypothetical protein
MMARPSGCAFAHPSDGFDHFFMRHFDRAQKYGLVVSYAISQTSNCIEATVNCAARLTAEHFLDVCRGYVAALQSGALNTERQREIAIQCSTLLSSCAKVGLIALIDEATGYQYERAEDALQVKLRAFIADELRAWEKTFPDELWAEFGRLTNRRGSLHKVARHYGRQMVQFSMSLPMPDESK